VQYGPNGSAFAVYMTQYQLLPYQRTAGCSMSWPAWRSHRVTLQRAVRVATTRLEAPVTAIRDALVAAPVAHADETSRRVNGTLHWLPVLSTNRLTAYFPHPKRGAEVLDAFGLLSQLVGVLVHEHGSACQRYQCLHAFCNAHHLRELIAIAERSPSQPWATDMITLLCQANAVVGEAQAQDLETLPASNGEQLWTRYDPVPAPAGRVKQSPACNLIRRLHERRNEVLRFLTDRRVPFDNNQAERDLRMPKLKQKASGCFRSDTGAGDFAIIRSYLPTLRKQSDDQLARPDLPGPPPNAPIGVAE